MIVDTNNKYYRDGAQAGPATWNGAYYYSLEIGRNIIPRVKTDRSWITVNAPAAGAEDGAIVFIHNNKNPDHYAWLKRYKDLILVCGVPETCEKVAHLGTAIYLPLSIDVKEVRKHRGNKTREVAFVGRPPKRAGIQFPAGTDLIEGMPRDRLLDEVARYRKIYAVGRCAIEAVCLGCEILPYDPRYPDPFFWQVIDNKTAAIMLQNKLDRIEEAKDK